MLRFGAQQTLGHFPGGGGHIDPGMRILVQSREPAAAPECVVGVPRPPHRPPAKAPPVSAAGPPVKGRTLAVAPPPPPQEPVGAHLLSSQADAGDAQSALWQAL